MDDEAIPPIARKSEIATPACGGLATTNAQKKAHDTYDAKLTIF